MPQLEINIVDVRITRTIVHAVVGQPVSFIGNVTFVSGGLNLDNNIFRLTIIDPWVTTLLWFDGSCDLPVLLEDSISIPPGTSRGFKMVVTPTYAGFKRPLFGIQVPWGETFLLRVREGPNVSCGPGLEMIVSEGSITAQGNGIAGQISGPGVDAALRIRAHTRIRVGETRIIQSPVRVSIRNHFVLADLGVRIGLGRVVNAKSHIKVSQKRDTRSLARIRVGREITAGAASQIKIRNHIVKGSARIAVGASLAVLVPLSVRVHRAIAFSVQSRVFVSFIDVEQLKRDMQIQFGSDTDLETETFKTVPIVQGVLYLQNLNFALIQVGSETVRRLDNPAATASGLYGIDYTRGRFAWFGVDGEHIELTYRRSVSRITDENITGAIIKATAMIRSMWRANVDVTHPRFLRGGVELTMTYLMDSAIFNAINNIKEFQGQKLRIVALNSFKTDMEKRAYETLAPFITIASPGNPTAMRLARSIRNPFR